MAMMLRPPPAGGGGQAGREQREQVQSRRAKQPYDAGQCLASTRNFLSGYAAALTRQVTQRAEHVHGGGGVQAAGGLVLQEKKAKARTAASVGPVARMHPEQVWM